MLKIFSHDDSFLIQQCRSELEAEGIPYLLKNEYARGAMGELPWQDVQLEIWLIDVSWLDKAKRIIGTLTAIQQKTMNHWCCQHCGEMNEGNFRLCWHCQQPLNEDVLPQY